MARNYRAEYDKYQGTEQQKKNRAARNAARAKMMKAGKVKKGDGKDVAHVKAFDKGGSNGDGLPVRAAALGPATAWRLKEGSGIAARPRAATNECGRG